MIKLTIQKNYYRDMAEEDVFTDTPQTARAIAQAVEAYRGGEVLTWRKAEPSETWDFQEIAVGMRTVYYLRAPRAYSSAEAYLREEGYKDGA